MKLGTISLEPSIELYMFPAEKTDVWLAGWLRSTSCFFRGSFLGFPEYPRPYLLLKIAVAGRWSSGRACLSGCQVRSPRFIHFLFLVS